MGDYTRCTLDVKLKKDVRPEVVEFLKWLLIGPGWPSSSSLISHGNGKGSTSDVYDQNPPFPDDHPYFKVGRYFDIGSDYVQRGDKFDDSRPTKMELVDDQWHLRIYSDVKNYDSQLQLFHDWLSPYCELTEGQVLGDWSSQGYYGDSEYQMQVKDGKITEVRLPEEPDHHGWWR